MYLETLQIMGLFGKFDRFVDLRHPEHITIIYGENGIGKTTILEIIDRFCNRDWDALLRLRFRQIRFNLVIEANDREIYEVFAEHERELIKGKKTPADFTLIWALPVESHISVKIKKEKDNHVFNSSMDFWGERKIEYTKRLVKLLEIDFDDLAEMGASDEEIELQYFFQKLTYMSALLQTYYIPAQRLNLDKDSWSRLLREFRPLRNRMLPGGQTAFMKALEEDKKRVLEMTPENQKESTIKLFDNFLTPLQLLTLRERNTIKFDKLKDLALIQEIKTISSLLAQMTYKSQVPNLDLFYELINNLLVGKRLEITPDEGLVIKAEDGEQIPLNGLSSGEINLIIIFFSILFRTSDNSLVLIDEPEISLHVVWQNAFIEDLRKIQERKPLRFLLATHSPQIVHDRRELCVDIQNKED